MPSHKMNLRDRVEDGVLDLSMSDLEEVPVRDIAAIKKATTLDLSNNRLRSLGKNFATLKHLVKLDLSKNMLTELPENFGDLVLLKHLDLYSNQLTHLPLSMSRLRALRWLDLKNNPLVPAVAEVAGPCLDAQQCAQCARSIVPFLQTAQETIEEERGRRLLHQRKQQELAELAALNQKKKEESKKKKKAAKALSNAQAKAANGVKASARSELEDDRPVTDGAEMRHSKTKLTAAKSTSVARTCWKLLLVLLSLCSVALAALWLIDPPRFTELSQALEVHVYAALTRARITGAWLRDHETTRWASDNMRELWLVLVERARDGWFIAQGRVSHYLDALRNKLLGAV